MPSLNGQGTATRIINRAITKSQKARLYFVASGKGLVVTRRGGAAPAEAKPGAASFLDVTIDRADHPIVADTGAEIVAGSTRMR